MPKKYASVMKEQCVACGCCMMYCPKQAIHIEKGMFAVVDKDLCVGCSKCKTVCPASVIVMEDRNEN